MSYIHGTNTRVELLALRGLLHFASLTSIGSIHIFGESKVIANWKNGTLNLQVQSLIQWIECTRLLSSSFSNIVINHVYREHNTIVDDPSKDALKGTMGNLHVVEQNLEGTIVFEDSFFD